MAFQILLVFCCYKKTYHKLSFRNLAFISSQFCRSWVETYYGWVQCSRPHKAKIKPSAGLYSFLEALGKNLPSSFWYWFLWLQGWCRFFTVSSESLSAFRSCPLPCHLAPSIFKTDSGESPSTPLNPSYVVSLLNQSHSWVKVIKSCLQRIIFPI